MTQVKFRPFHTGRTLILELSIPLNVLSSVSAFPSLSAADLKMITGEILWDQPLADLSAYRSAAASCEEATVDSLAVATLISPAISSRES